MKQLSRLCATVTLFACIEGSAAAQPEGDDQEADTSAVAPERAADEAHDGPIESEDDKPASAPPSPLPLPPPPPAPAPPTSPFQFSFKGTVAVTFFAQDTPVRSGNGLASLVGPLPASGDSWLIGADLRQSRFALNMSGPPLLGAASLASIEMEWSGGNQIVSVPAAPTQALVFNSMGMPVGSAIVPFTSSPQGDESLLPRLRTAYIELNWDAGTDVLRVGQYHNLLLAMISASGAHPAVLGYGAGQLGWRAPSISYSHRFGLSDTVKLDAALQVNRNSWIDNAPICLPGMAPPANNCLPAGVSLGEAGLPQVEARLMLLGPLAPSPWPHYAPLQWLLFVVGHWDQKDLSGVNNVAAPPLRESMTTYIVEGGGKLLLGPLHLAVNGWYGQNAGGVFGHIFQMQTPDKPDVTGFGSWGQIGLSLWSHFSVWAFAGIDQPNRDQALAAGFTSLRNLQLAAMLAYVNGPLMASLEWFHLATTSLSSAGGVPPTELTTRANQPSVTFAYAF